MPAEHDSHENICLFTPQWLCYTERDLIRQRREAIHRETSETQRKIQDGFDPGGARQWRK